MRSALIVLVSLFTAIFPAHAVEPVKIGVSLSLTGKYAELGTLKFNAYKLWQQDVNQKGGILGKPVKLIVLDDQSEPNVAKALYERLIVEEKVDLVLGPYSSAVTSAVLPVTEKYGYPLLASGGAADEIWQQGYKHVFGVYIPASKYTVGFLELLVTNGISNIAMIAADDIFSQSVAAGAREWAKRYGLNVVFFETFKKGAKDLAPVVTRAKASNAQVFMVLGHFDESVDARRALKLSGWSPRVYYASVGPTTQKYYEMLKTDAELSFSSSQWEPSTLLPGSKEFADIFEKTYGSPASYHAANAYAAGQILDAAVNKAKSFDRNKIRDVLSSLDTITIIGRYGVDHTGKQIRHFARTVQWQNGKREIVAPAEIMTAKPVWK